MIVEWHLFVLVTRVVKISGCFIGGVQYSSVTPPLFLSFKVPVLIKEVAGCLTQWPLCTLCTRKEIAFVLPRPGLDITTQSPVLSVVTSEPTEVTTPTPSPPPTAGRGGLMAYTPRYMCTKALATQLILLVRKIFNVYVWYLVSDWCRLG